MVGAQQGLKLRHRRARLVAHQVEAEGVDAVFTRPQPHRVQHQPAHHPVLGCAVVAAGAALHHAGRIQPVVVTGHDAVEHRIGMLARRRQVVVDHVHAHPQAGAVQRHHHLAELADADGAIIGPAGKAAFGGVEVQRVVAPVVAIPGGAGHHRRLLRQAVRRGLRHSRGAAAALGHAGQIEDRQQVHVRQAGAGQRCQMPQAGAARVGKGRVLPAQGLGQAGIVGREIAHMQLVDHRIGGAAQRRRAQRLGPAGRLQRRRVEPADPAAARIRPQADRVRVGHALAQQALAGHPDIDQVVEVLAAQIARQVGRPGAGGRISPQRLSGQRRAVVALVAAQPHLPGGGRPQGQAGAGQQTPLARRDLHTQRYSLGAGIQVARRDLHTQRYSLGAGIQIVQGARILQTRALHDAAGGILQHQPQFTPVQAAQPARIGCGGRQRQPGPSGHMAKAGRHAGRQRPCGNLQIERAVGPPHRLARHCLQAAQGRVVKPEPTAAGVNAGPLQGLAIKPDRARFDRRSRRRGPQNREVGRRIAGQGRCGRRSGRPGQSAGRYRPQPQADGDHPAPHAARPAPAHRARHPGPRQHRIRQSEGAHGTHRQARPHGLAAGIVP